MFRTLAAAVFLCLPALSPADEIFQWSPQVVDFRSVPIGAELTQTVRLTNRGKQTWRIVGTTTTCGCARATSDASGTLHADTDLLIPDGSVTVTVTAKPKRLGPSNGALFLKLEECGGGEGAAGTRESIGVDVRIRGTRPLALADDRVDLGAIPLGKEFSRSVPVQLASGESFRIEEIRTAGLPLRCEKEADEMAARGSLKFSTSPEARPGSFSHGVVLSLRVGDRTEQAVLRVAGDVQSDLATIPDRVVMVPGRDVDVAVESRAKSPFRIEKCLSHPPGVEVAGLDDMGGKLSIRWTPDSGSSSRSGELIFQVSGHLESRLYLPVHFLRPEPALEGRE